MNRLLTAVIWGGLAAAILAVSVQPSAEPLVLVESAPISERVLELPEDGGRWSTIVVYPDGAKDVDSRAIASWFATTPRLQSLKAQTKYFEWPASHWWVRTYRPRTPAPFVLVLDENSRPIYEAYRDEMPGDGEQLCDEIEMQISDCCPDVKPKEPEQEWQPRRVIPSLRPKSPAKDANQLAVVLAVLASGGAIAWRSLRDRAPTE